MLVEIQFPKHIHTNPDCALLYCDTAAFSVDTNVLEEQAAYISRAEVIMIRVIPRYTGRVTEYSV